jgi:O-methyltransferase
MSKVSPFTRYRPGGSLLKYIPFLCVAAALIYGILNVSIASLVQCRNEVIYKTNKGEIHKISYEKREEITCPNDCSGYITSKNQCKGNVCECSPDLSGADCSYSKSECNLQNTESLVAEASAFYGRRRGSYDGFVQSKTHTIMGNKVIQNRIPGDVVEFGVFKGGSSSVLARVFNACSSKRLWLYDSFAGHPSIDADLNPGMKKWEGKHIGTLEDVKANIRGLNPNMDENKLIWKKGFFNETLKQELPKIISYLHIDCDWYECHIDILDALYDRVAWGGVIVCDDAGFYGFARAGLFHWLQKHQKVVALRSTFGVGEAYGGGSHFWVKGYEGAFEHSLLTEPIWPGGASPPVS